MKKVWIVDDDVSVTNYLLVFLMQTGLYDLTVINVSEEIPGRLKEETCDLMLLDMDMPVLNGLDILKVISERGLDIAVVVLTGVSDVDLAVSSMKLGAFDYLIKPVEEDQLLSAMEKALKDRELKSSIAVAPEEPAWEDLRQPEAFKGFITQDAVMKKQIYLADRFAGTDEPVLINGESGSGISLLAKAIHDASTRRDGPFVKMYAWVYEKEHFEKQFFGQEADWSGDAPERPGIVEQAAGGTLLLRKVQSLSNPAQLKLLALLQTGRYRRHGSAQEREADFRLITACRSDLMPMLESGEFVDDLLYHMNINRLSIPPLRERPGDVLPLAEHFLHLAKDKGAKPSRLSEDLVELLRAYRWPGNVRELKEMIEYGAVAEQHDELKFESLHAIARGRLDPEFKRGEHTLKPWTLKEVEKEHIKAMLRAHDGNLNSCAETLGISLEELKSKVENGG